MPGISPLKVVEADDADPKTAVEGPDNCVQLPLPSTGLLAASKTLFTLHKFWSVPALAMVEAPYMRISVESVWLQPCGEIAVIRYRTIALVPAAAVNRSVMVLVADAVALDELPVTVPETTDEFQVKVEPASELLNCRLVVLPVQTEVVVLVMVMAGLGLAVTVRVKGVPLQLTFDGVNA